MNLKIVQAAFLDELEKIAGEMQGHVRTGRKPIGIERLLEREGEVVSPSEELGLADAHDVEKDAMPSPSGRDVALIGGGALLYHHGRKMKRRYEVGKQMEMQSTGM